jgi:hypothetical protein
MRTASAKFNLGRASLWALAGALVLLFMPGGVWAQEGEVSARASVDKDTVNIGDVIAYVLTITHSPELEVHLPALGAHHGPFEIRERQVLPERQLQDGQRQRVIHYLISTFTTGQQKIPPVEITYLDSAGQTGTISAEEIAIAVESLNPDTAGDIRDLKPPASLPGSHSFMYWLMAALLLIAAGVTVFVRLRKSKMHRALDTVENQGPPRPAHEIALEELERIAALNLIQRGLIKEFYTQITEVIKRYIGRRYQITSMESTTAELMEAMKRASLPGEHIQAYGLFFQESDLVKFAKHIPVQERIGGVLDEARNLVLSTRERPVAAVARATSALASESTVSGER